MKKILTTIVIVIIVLVSLIYIDYFNAKTNYTSPKISLKEETDDAIEYKAVLYRVWFCKTNKMYLVGDYSEDLVCPKNYKYENNVYKNENGVEITKRDLQLLTNDGIYTSEMIENMNSNKQVEDAVHVAFNYLKYKYKKVDKENGVDIALFPEFKEVDGNYRWVYDEEGEDKYCIKEKDGILLYAKYLDNKCGKYEEVVMDELWCEAYKNSTLVYKSEIQVLCKEQ